MDARKLWNLIVQEHKNLYSALEEKVQERWETYCSEIFGYKKLLGEIGREKIPVGAGIKTITDITIKKNNIRLFNLELKQYSLPFNASMQQQLISYLDVLHTSVGILVCKTLHIYSYNYSANSYKKWEIPFEMDNTDGIRFIGLFHRDNFSKAAVEEFIDEKNKLEEDIKNITSSISKELITNLLVEHFSKSYSKETIDKALSSINITIGKTIGDPPQPPETDGTDNSNIYDEPSFDYVIIKTTNVRVDFCNGSLYHATRWAWKAGPRIEKYNYVLSVIDQIVQAVYRVKSWDKVFYWTKTGQDFLDNNINDKEIERYYFDGEDVSQEYGDLIGKKIPAKYRKRGNASPVVYKKD